MANFARAVAFENCAKFAVNPANSRTALAAFITAAKKELLIYDPTVVDRAMRRLLEERKNAGMEEADETPKKGVGENAGAGIQDACPGAPS